MVKKLVGVIILLIILTAAALPQKAPDAAPSQAGLLEAWEKSLRADPNTEILERTAEKTYHFKTRLFPFDGELKVLNALIQSTPEGEYTPEFAFGNVEIELVGFSQEMMTKYAQSYGYWLQHNTLYFDHEDGRWLDAKEYRSILPRRMKKSYDSPWSWLSRNYFWIILAVLSLFLWRLAQRSGKQMKSAMSRQDEVMEHSRKSMAIAEKSIELQMDSNRVLKEILEILKERGK